MKKGRTYVIPPKEEAPLCACGCGESVTWNKWVKKWTTYINGHGNKGRKISDEWRENLRKSHIGIKLSEEAKKKLSEAAKGRILSEEHKQKISKSHFGIKHSEATKRKISAIIKPISKNLWKNPEYREKTIKATASACSNKKNKLEIALEKLCALEFPGSYKYNGLGPTKIGGKTPDFINIKNQRKVIEVFGEYWHGKKHTGKTKKQNKMDRKNHYKKYNYKCLVIWEHEFKDLNKIKEKIVRFNKT